MSSCVSVSNYLVCEADDGISDETQRVWDMLMAPIKEIAGPTATADFHPLVSVVRFDTENVHGLANGARTSDYLLRGLLHHLRREPRISDRDVPLSTGIAPATPIRSYRAFYTEVMRETTPLDIPELTALCLSYCMSERELAAIVKPGSEHPTATGLAYFSISALQNSKGAHPVVLVDTHSGFDAVSGRYTVPACAGIWQLHASVHTGQKQSPHELSISVRHNGVVVQSVSSGERNTILSVSVFVTMGDVLDLLIVTNPHCFQPCTDIKWEFSGYGTSFDVAPDYSVALISAQDDELKMELLRYNTRWNKQPINGELRRNWLIQTGMPLDAAYLPPPDVCLVQKSAADNAFEFAVHYPTLLPGNHSMSTLRVIVPANA